MELRVCEYCGTEFSADLTECPLCGKAVDPDELLIDTDTVTDSAGEQSEENRGAEKRKPGQRLASRKKKGRGGKFSKPRKTTPENLQEEPEQSEPGANPYRIPKWMMALICVFLGLAVLIGAAFACYNMGFFGKRVSSLSSQADSQEKQAEASASAAASASQSASSQVSSSQPASSSQYTNEEDQHTQSTQTQQPAAASVACTGLTLSPTTVTFDESDQFANLTVSLQPTDCTEKVSYASSDDSIATVNAQGKIVAVKGGSVTITASCGTQKATCLVTCDFKTQTQTTEPTATPTLSSSDMTLFYPGEKANLTVKDAPAGASISYKSSDTSIATVTDSGVVSAVTGGTATVTVTVGTQTLSCIVRCNLTNSAETGTTDANCTISNSDVTMSVTGEYFKLTLKDSSGKTVSGLSWSSTDSGVCTVDASGVVYAKGSGTANVTTTYGGKTYSCIVRCHLG
jgi:uncharacterized protein YjdB